MRDDRVLTLNYGDTFGILRPVGGYIKQFGTTCVQEYYGIYHQGTRFINSDMELETNVITDPCCPDSSL